MPNRLVLLLALCALAMPGSLEAAGSGPAKAPVRQLQTASHAERMQEEVSRLKEAVKQKRSQAWRWQRVALHAPTRASYIEDRTQSLKMLRWTLRLWKHRAATAKQVATHPPHLADWQCIHRGEGAWDDDTGNGYYGGLQMDIPFQKRYGYSLYVTKGTANNWTPLEQVWVAERAYESGRGFWPWPNTARACGLI